MYVSLPTAEAHRGIRLRLCILKFPGKGDGGIELKCALLYSYSTRLHMKITWVKDK